MAKQILPLDDWGPDVFGLLVGDYGLAHISMVIMGRPEGYKANRAVIRSRKTGKDRPAPPTKYDWWAKRARIEMFRQTGVRFITSSIDKPVLCHLACYWDNHTHPDLTNMVKSGEDMVSYTGHKGHGASDKHFSTWPAPHRYTGDPRMELDFWILDRTIPKPRAKRRKKTP